MQPVSAFKQFERKNIKQTALFEDNKKKEKNTDPLSKYPLRLCAYANEVGAALSPINASLATSLWVPALMYFGADIYDKYKNENTNYNPSKKRGFEQTVFQTLSSILLPTAAVRIGQKAASHFTHWDKSGLSPDVKKEIIEFTLNSIKENRLSQNTKTSLKQSLDSNFKNKLNNLAPELLKERPLQKIKKILFESSEPVHSISANQTKVFNYLSDKVDEIYEVRESLIKGTKSPLVSEKLHKYFNKQVKRFKDMYPDNYVDKAAKSSVNKLLKQQNFKINIPATIGGFIALAVAAVPIDLFVEKVVIKKMVEPGINFFDNSFKGKNK